uniref:Uncharacterized protein n=2 Tax=Cercopithecinae TaxID=9528 RepID=A0A2K5XUZ0_MANLE
MVGPCVLGWQLLLPLLVAWLWRALPMGGGLWLVSFSPPQQMCVDFMLDTYHSPINRSSCLTVTK